MLVGATLLVAPVFIGAFVPLIGLAVCLAVVAIVLGHLGWKQSRKQRKFVLAGLILGYSGIGLALVMGALMVISVFLALARYG
jgi:TRAP-type C4-dicarboxylate transport system permease small subunit